jgi:hypothetical protein
VLSHSRALPRDVLQGHEQRSRDAATPPGGINCDLVDVKLTAARLRRAGQEAADGDPGGQRAR